MEILPVAHNIISTFLTEQSNYDRPFDIIGNRGVVNTAS